LGFRFQNDFLLLSTCLWALPHKHLGQVIEVEHKSD